MKITTYHSEQYRRYFTKYGQLNIRIDTMEASFIPMPLLNVSLPISREDAASCLRQWRAIHKK